MKDRLPPCRSGFTLIEMSIVLVIIGLVVGGILVGRDLIHAAELRSVLTDIERFNTAVNVFTIKYDCLPGDCSTAERYFGTDSNGCPQGGGATGTCNGNGDQVIAKAVLFAATYNSENFRAWQQLADAGLIQGHYSGIEDDTLGGPAGITIGSNVPASRIGHSGYTFVGCNAFGDASGNNWYPGNAQGTNCITFGDTRGYHSGAWYENNYTHYQYALGPVISGDDAKVLDTKADDGKPGTGAITAPFYQTWGYGEICTTFAGYDNDYDAGNPASLCSLIFRMD